MKKQAVIILHGWNLRGSRFSGLAARITRLGFSVHTPDLPGFGASPAPEVPWHVADYARYLDGYISSHAIEKPILIGHSFGGRVAIVYAQLYPDGVSQLILTGTPGFSPVAQSKMTFFLILAKIGGFFFSLPGIRVFADRARRLLYRAAGAHEFYRAEGSMRQTFKNTVNDDLVSAMQSIRVPCLLIWGNDDPIVPVSVAQRMKETITGSALTVVPNSGHGLPFETPDRFIDAVKKRLAA